MTANPWTGLRPVALGLLLFPALPAQNLTSDQVLRIHFTVPSTYTPRPPDVLRLNFGLIQVHSAFAARNAAIYHCDQRLGTASSTSFGNHVGALNLDPSNSWKSPTSLWNFDSPATIDFTRIVNGTLTGIIEFTITTGAVTIPLNQINLNFVAATGTSGGTVVTPPPTITHRIVSPKLTGPTPGLVNVQNTWTMTALQPMQPAFFAFGTQCMPFPVLGDMFDLANPLVFAGALANANGVATLSVFVPGSAAGGRIMVQGIQIVGSNLQFTNLAAHTF